MKITKLSLTNFRSFKKTQTIEFAPTTLLFGPNSAGKSTVLMALFYVQHILEHRNCDPHTIEALGNKFIGGFKNLVNGRDLDKSITIKIEYTKGEEIGSTYYDPSQFDEIAENQNLICAGMPEIMMESDNIAIEFTISFSNLAQEAFIESYKVFLNNEFIAEITSDEGAKLCHITEINIAHPLLQNEDQRFTEKLIKLPIAIKGTHGALPILGKALDIDFPVNNILNKLQANAIFSEVVISPLDNVSEILKSTLCIGPLRVIPDQEFKANPSQTDSSWYDGKAAWHKIHTYSDKFAMDFNYWLKEKLKLNLEYKDVTTLLNTLNEGEEDSYSAEKLLLSATSVLTPLAFGALFGGVFSAATSVVSRAAIGALAGTATSALLDFYVKNEKDKGETKFATLYDTNNKIIVTPSDVGVGISQLLPLLVAGLSNDKGLVTCEQPELHVHPRIQVELGDFFTQSNPKINYLIETHSEHLILRILRRIRETTDGELTEDIKPVYPEDVSIMYIEPSEDGVQVKRINIDEDGEFEVKWPQGFFSERREELM